MKTVNWATAVAVLDQDKCTGCFRCVFVCPEESITTTEVKVGDKSKPKVTIDLTNCKGCGLCATECPTKVSAITMLGVDDTAAQSLLKKVLK